MVCPLFWEFPADGRVVVDAPGRVAFPVADGGVVCVLVDGRFTCVPTT